MPNPIFLSFSPPLCALSNAPIVLLVSFIVAAALAAFCGAAVGVSQNAHSGGSISPIWDARGWLHLASYSLTVIIPPIMVANNLKTTLYCMFLHPTVGASKMRLDLFMPTSVWCFTLAKVADYQNLLTSHSGYWVFGCNVRPISNDESISVYGTYFEMVIPVFSHRSDVKHLQWIGTGHICDGESVPEDLYFQILRHVIH